MSVGSICGRLDCRWNLSASYTTSARIFHSYIYLRHQLSNAIFAHVVQPEAVGDHLQHLGTQQEYAAWQCKIKWSTIRSLLFYA